MRARSWGWLAIVFLWGVITFVAKDLTPYSVFRAMNGADYFFYHHVPWAPMALSAGTAAAFGYLALRSVEARDFSVLAAGHRADDEERLRPRAPRRAAARRAARGRGPARRRRSARTARRCVRHVVADRAAQHRDSGPRARRAPSAA